MLRLIKPSVNGRIIHVLNTFSLLNSFDKSYIIKEVILVYISKFYLKNGLKDCVEFPNFRGHKKGK